MSKIRYLGDDALRYFKDKFINKGINLGDISEDAEIIDIYTNKFIIVDNKYVKINNDNSKLNGYILIKDKGNIYRIDAYFSSKQVISNNIIIGNWIINQHNNDDFYLTIDLTIDSNNGIINISKEYKKYVLDESNIRCLLYDKDNYIDKQLIYTKSTKREYFDSIFKAKYIKIDKFTYIPINYNINGITSVVLKCIDVNNYLVDYSIFDIKISCEYNDNVAIINSINSDYANKDE